MKKNIDFTVAICTYNGANRLPEVFDSLTQQINPENLFWEILVIDNNSTDNTAEMISQYAQNWRDDSQIRYIFEPIQGQAKARQTAVEKANSELIGFLDDDNLPTKNWVIEAYKFGQQNPEIGAYGSIIEAKLDMMPPPYFEQIKSLLAVNNPGSQTFCYRRTDKPRKVPAGAGCVVRKLAWLQCVPPNLSRQGRDKNEKTMLGCGEDTEALYHIQNSHWQIWHNPEMKFYHHLESRRLEKEYLLRLAKGFGLANYTFRLTRLYSWQRPIFPLLLPFYFISDGYKLIYYYFRHYNQLNNDLPIACELQARIGRFLSNLQIFRY